MRPEMIQELWDQIGGQKARQEAYQFVTPEFQAMADAAYADIGLPRITLTTAWTIFSVVVGVLRGRL